MTPQEQAEQIRQAWTNIGKEVERRFRPLMKSLNAAMKIFGRETQRTAVTLQRVFNPEQLEDFKRLGRYGSHPNFDQRDLTWVCDSCSAWLHEACTDRELCCCRTCVRCKLNTARKTRRVS